jgi:SagB-type dehydrogenase family enzyme
MPDHDSVNQAVERALDGHRAGEQTLEALREPVAPASWPQAWRQHERKAFPRFGIRQLPSPAIDNNQRMSVREFSDARLSIGTVSEALSVLRISARPGGGLPNRRTPSAGALYPVEVYLISLNTELGTGVFYYDAEEHGVCKLFDIPEHLDGSTDKYLGITHCLNVPLLIAYSSVMYRNMRKYGARGYRYALLEVGGMASAIDNRSCQLALATVWLGGFADSAVCQLLGLRPELDMEIPILLQAVGHPKPSV